MKKHARSARTDGAAPDPGGPQDPNRADPTATSNPGDPRSSRIASIGQAGIGHACSEAALPRRHHAALAGVFILALALRLIYLAGQAAHNPTFDAPIMDMRVHHEWASQFARGEPMRAIADKPYFRAPLYYYTLGVVYHLFGAKVWIGRVFGCALGAASCYLIARLGSRLEGFRVGLVAGVLAAIYWPLWYFDAELKTVGLEVFLDLLLLLALLWAARQRRTGWAYALAGLMWGLSAITRPNVLAVLPGITLWLFATLRDSDWRGSLKRTATATGWLLAGAAVAILPVTLRNAIVGREFVLIASQGGVNFYIGNNPYNADGFTAVVPGTRPGWWEGFEDTHRIPEIELGRKLTEGEVSAYWSAKSWDWIAKNPGAWVRRLLYKLALFWTPVEVSNNQPIDFFAGLSGLSWAMWIGFPVVSVLALAGLTCIWSNRREWLLPLMFMVLYMGTVVLFFCPGRYRVPVVPVLMILASLALVRITGWIRERRIPRLIGAGIAVALGAMLMAMNPAPDGDRKAFARIGEAEGQAILASHYTETEDGGTPDYARASEHMAKAVALRGDDAYLRWRYGAVLARCGEAEKAEEQFKLGAALAGRVKDAEPLFRYGQFLASQRRWTEAAAQFEGALAMQPAYADARSALDAARRAAREAADSDEAIETYRQSLAAAPNDTPALLKLGGALIRRGRSAEAIAPLERALTLAPGDDAIRQASAEAYRRTARFADALRVLEPAVVEDRSGALLTAAAWLLATAPDDALRDGRRAMTLAKRAQQLSGPDVPQILDALAAAHAELGEFDKAVEVAHRAADLAAAQGKGSLSVSIRSRGDGYREKRPFRDSTDAGGETTDGHP
ncbi:MAG: glycosyltransferase family 39 protein [Phycisphaerales bacterium]|nr:glycosyltransferase family 39 protein [Phycisphaerales bacterium]